MYSNRAYQSISKNLVFFTDGTDMQLNISAF